MRIAVSITLFLLFQVAAALLFKWGSARQRPLLVRVCGRKPDRHNEHPVFDAHLPRASPESGGGGLHGRFVPADSAGDGGLLHDGLSPGQWSGVFLTAAGIALLALA